MCGLESRCFPPGNRTSEPPPGGILFAVRGHKWREDPSPPNFPPQWRSDAFAQAGGTARNLRAAASAVSPPCFPGRERDIFLLLSLHGASSLTKSNSPVIA